METEKDEETVKMSQRDSQNETERDEETVKRQCKVKWLIGKYKNRQNISGNSTKTVKMSST